jgi:hypothetical protein
MNTYPPEYLRLESGAVRRLAALRLENPDNWREARRYGFHNAAAAYATLDQGSNDDRPVWYCHTGPEFRDERYADEVYSGIRHKGWFTDAQMYDVARGIVGRLTHGRFIAGYELSMNDERVYYPDVFDDETDAARAADEHARIIGEQESDYARGFQEMQELESEIETRAQGLARSFALRNNARFPDARDEVREMAAEIREMRERLTDEFAQYR